jgi:hypothetical protein
MYKDESPLRQFTKFSYSGYNAMRTKKQFDGFLSASLYERFYNANIAVEKFIDCGDDTERMAYLKINNHHNPIVP